MPKEFNAFDFRGVNLVYRTAADRDPVAIIELQQVRCNVRLLVRVRISAKEIIDGVANDLIRYYLFHPHISRQ